MDFPKRETNNILGIYTTEQCIHKDENGVSSFEKNKNNASLKTCKLCRKSIPQEKTPIDEEILQKIYSYELIYKGWKCSYCGMGKLIFQNDNEFIEVISNNGDIIYSTIEEEYKVWVWNKWLEIKTKIDNR